MPIELPDPDIAPPGRQRLAYLALAVVFDLAVNLAACWQRDDIHELTSDEFIFGDGAHKACILLVLVTKEKKYRIVYLNQGCDCSLS